MKISQMGEGGCEIDNGQWVIGTLSVQSSQLGKRSKIGLNQSIIYIHPFHTVTPIFFYLYLSNSVAKKKKLFLGRKKSLAEYSPAPPPQVTPMITGPKSQTNDWTWYPDTAFVFHFVIST
jgi:hypothetical protein